MHSTLRSRARNVFRVQLYKNNAHALLSRILSIVNSDWLQHVHMVRRVFECYLSMALCLVGDLLIVKNSDKSLLETMESL